MRAGRRRSAQAGFTIVEVLLALTIVFVGFLALTKLHVMSARANGLARRQTMATILAYEQIERFHRLGSATGGSDTPTMDGFRFQRSWTTSTNAAGSTSVQMTVQWSDQWGTRNVKIPAILRK